MVVDGPVGFEIVEEPAPWAGVAHKGKGKASRGARILEDDDGGPVIVVLDIYVCLYNCPGFYWKIYNSFYTWLGSIAKKNIPKILKICFLQKDLGFDKP